MKELWEAVYDAGDEELQIYGLIVMNTLAHSVAVLHLQKSEHCESG